MAPADRVPHVMDTRAAKAPEFLLRPELTGRSGQDYKTHNEIIGGRNQGGEQRERGRGRHRTPKLCRKQARRINCIEIATITADDDPGASARSAKGVFT